MHMSQNEAITDPEPTGMPSGFPPESDSETDDHDISRMSTVHVTDWIKLQTEPVVGTPQEDTLVVFIR